MKKLLLLASAIAAVSLSGCVISPLPSSGYGHTTSQGFDPFLHDVAREADVMARQLSGLSLGMPVIVASAQNNDALRKVCPEGRLVSDIVSSQLTQRGIPVTEVRLTNNLRINAEGEQLLSRELSDLAKAVDATVAVTATWTTLSDTEAVARLVANESGAAAHAPSFKGRTYVTLKAVQLADGLVLSSRTFAPNIEAHKAWNCR